MKKIQISLNAMEAKVYELCKLATKGSDNGAMFCFDEVAVPAKKELSLSVEEVKGYLGSLKKKDAIRKLHDSYYDFFVPEKCDDDYEWPYMDELYTVEVIVEGAEKTAPSTKQFKIYQLPVEHNAKFMDYDFVTGHYIMPKLEDYNLVWEGEVEDDADLDDLYTKFNVGQKPEDYKGHSLSMSDLVKMDGKYFYCDRYGWVEVYSQPKNVITFASEDVPEEEIVTKEHEITLFYHNIHFAQNGDLLSGDIKIGTWEKEVLGGRDASGNKLVPYLYWITLNGMDKRKQMPYYSREEVKKSLDCKTVKVLLPF